MNLVDELYSIARALREAGVEYAICGGVAVTIHGYARATKDIDLLVAPRDLPKALEVVRTLGYVIPAQPMTFGAGTASERHVQRVTKVEERDLLTLDLLSADSAYEGLLAGRVELPFSEGVVFVVSRESLLRMKRLAGRPQDLLDIEKLERGDEA